MIPDLIKLTENFCNEFRIFTDFICSNDLIAEYLKNESIINDYYDHELKLLEEVQENIENNNEKASL